MRIGVNGDNFIDIEISEYMWCLIQSFSLENNMKLNNT